MTWLKMLLLSFLKFLDRNDPPLCPNFGCKGRLFEDEYRDLDGDIISRHRTCSHCGKIVSGVRP